MKRMIVGSAKRLGIALTVTAVVVAPARVANAATDDAGSRPAFAVSSPAAAAAGPANVGVKASSKAGVAFWVQLRNLNTNETKCMGVEGGRPANGSRVVLWECGSSDHWWAVDFDGGYHEIRNNNDRSKCLGVLGGSHNQGAPLVTWDCDGSPNQKWRTEGSSECDGVILVNQATTPAQLASVEGGSTQNNASIIQWPHGSTRDQTWCTWA